MPIKCLKPNISTLDTRRAAPVATERIRGDMLRIIRERIGLRDEYTCQECGHVTAAGQVDHITPLHLGGNESDENRQWLCVPCHKKKSASEEKGRST